MEKVPEEIWEEIFCYLDIESLEAVADVSEFWASIIRSSVRIGSKLRAYVFTFLGKAKLAWPGDKDETSPINKYDFKYGHLKFGGNSEPTINDALYNASLQKVCGNLKKEFIRKLTIEESPNRFINSWLSGITHLKVNLYRQTYSLTEMTGFKDLKRLELYVPSINDENMEVSISAKLTHLKIHQFLYNQFHEDVFNIALRSQTSTLQELRLLNMRLDNESVQLFITNCRQLKTLELDLRKLAGCLNLIEAIKHHKQWKELNFKYNSQEHLKTVGKIYANHPNVSSLTFHCPHFERSIEELPNCQSLCLHLERIGRKITVEDIMPFVKNCRELKILKIHLSTYTVGPDIMSTILENAKNLDELHLFKHCKTEVGLKTLQVIKDKGKKLKKLIVAIVPDKVDYMREKMKIFNDANIRTVVPSCSFFEHYDYIYNCATCTWKL